MQAILKTGEINESGMTFNIFAIWFEEMVSNYLLTHETSTGGVRMIDSESDIDSDDGSLSEAVTMRNGGSEVDSDYNYDLYELNQIKTLRNWELETALEGAIVVKENPDQVTDDDSCSIM